MCLRSSGHNIEDYFSNKISSNHYNFHIDKSLIEINKFPSLLSINFFDVKITDKKQLLQSKLNEVKITFTAKDINLANHLPPLKSRDSA